jgi:hypothetical protein
MFRTIPLSIIRSFSLYTQLWYMLYRFVDSFRAGSGCSILILLERCQLTCVTYTIAVCTVKNYWWWTEELSETYRISFQNKFEKLLHLVSFIIRICHDAQSLEHTIGRYIFWNICKNSLNAPFLYTENWPEDCSLEPKHVANCVLIDCVCVVIE